ncbi:MAG TPA: S9 family peptidase [Phycisphaerales bacterium]|nr:S9 family peptidase [Phycisphaerales bacterium]
MSNGSSLVSSGRAAHWVRIFAGAAVVGVVSLSVWGAEPSKNAGKAGGMERTSPAALTVEKEKTLLEKFLNIRSPAAPKLSPDGTLFVLDRPEGVVQLFRIDEGGAVPVARTDSKSTQLTCFKDGTSGYSLSPDGKKILVSFAAGGNENTQVSVLDYKANSGKGAITPVLANPKVQYAVNNWLDDSSGFFYTGNDESPSDFYIYRYDFTPDGKGKTTKILAKEGTWGAPDCTGDASRILVSHYTSISDSSVFELNAASGELNELTIKPSDGSTSANEIVGYMPGEKTVLMLSDVDDGKPKVHLRDIATGKVTRPLTSIDNYEVDDAGMNRERTLLTVVTNEDGYGTLHLYRLPGFEEVSLPMMEKGVVGVRELRGDKLIYGLSNARTPGVSYLWEVPKANATGGSPPRQITFADDQGVDLSKFTLPDLVKYKAFDGTEISAFIYYPTNYKRGETVPFVVNYHGGPEGQSRPTYSSNIQYLLSQGFGVMQPNVRGSTGYGRSFHRMDDYKNRWASVRDGVDAAEWLVAQKLAKPGQIAAFGGSYGGYMSVATIVEDQNRVDEGKRPNRVFGASIDVVGIVNMKTFLEQTSGYRRKLREVEYGPLTDPDFLMEVSTINKIDKINVPMFIAHGLNDPRVPVGEAMQLAVGLKKRGLDPVECYFPDEGHGFAKVENQLVYVERMVKFLKDTIGK